MATQKPTKPTGRRHFHCYTRTYKSWKAMRRRCLSPDDQAFLRYGGAGISIDPKWDSFVAFLGDMGERPPGTSLDRIDGSAGYSKSNCRWATRSQQGRNKRNNKFVDYNGDRRCITEWAEIFGLSANALMLRLKKGESPPQLFRPVRYRRPPRTESSAS